MIVLNKDLELFNADLLTILIWRLLVFLGLKNLVGGIASLYQPSLNPWRSSFSSVNIFVTQPGSLDLKSRLMSLCFVDELNVKR